MIRTIAVERELLEECRKSAREELGATASAAESTQPLRCSTKGPPATQELPGNRRAAATPRGQYPTGAGELHPVAELIVFDTTEVLRVWPRKLHAALAELIDGLGERKRARRLVEEILSRMPLRTIASDREHPSFPQDPRRSRRRHERPQPQPHAETRRSIE